MKNLIDVILYGNFGILTSVPSYLIFSLLPAVFFFELIRNIVNIFNKKVKLSNRYSLLTKYGISYETVLSILMGFICVTAALSSLECTNKRERIIGSAILCIAVPCSSQVAIIASMIFLLNHNYILFFFIYIILWDFLLVLIMLHIFPLNATNLPLCNRFNKVSNLKLSSTIFTSIKQSLKFVLAALPAFTAASILVSILIFVNIFPHICQLILPYTCKFLSLPQEASSLFVLSLIKRELGATFLMEIVRGNLFSQGEITVALIVLTYFVPCFASLAILYEKEGFKICFLICLSTFLIASILGKIAAFILL